jgi:Holliday junction resolvase
MARKALIDVPLEKQVLDAIRKYLRSKGAYVVKQHGSGMSEAGVPDLLCCYKGRFIGIEVKRNHVQSRVSKIQEQHLLRIRAAGGIAIVARQVQDVREVLEAIDNNEGWTTT